MSPWSDEKLIKIINSYREYVVKYSPQAIVVKVPPVVHHSPEIKIIMAEIGLLAKKHGCEFDFITKDELKEATNTDNTQSLIERTVLLYPELNEVFERGPKSYLYYQRLYEAVLSARIYEEWARIKEVQE
ncbi:hypothetical protein [Mucilaginibacter ginsenosidivorax]|uniref:Uncharacterized protein n=1 Tax=Mucilaginibacter ginsenosidivorax TaxID=862126 RepID=A0A5B8W361_9SPHI|nr:hypothetical protein [Mucilaginibacter ginsenosidivorax]QEC77382.1 hypothetical protein FSB76_16030 [Mucilaginibacter ginsenosidivorax]